MKIFISMILGLSIVILSAVSVQATGSDRYEYGMNLRTRFISQQKFTGQEDINLFNKAQASQDIAAQLNSLSALGKIPTKPLDMKGADDDYIGNLSYFDIRARFYATTSIYDQLTMMTKVDINGVSPTGGETDAGITNRYNAESDTGTKNADIELINFYFGFNPDYRQGPFHLKAGLMPSELARGLICNDESVFQIQVIRQISRALYFPITYTRNDNFGIGKGKDRASYDSYSINPIFFRRHTFISPFYCYTRARGGADTIESNHFSNILGSVDRHDVGIDIRIEKKKFSLWFTGVHQFGSMTVGDEDNAIGLVFLNGLPAIGANIDFNGSALIGGGEINITSFFEIHSEFIYATGEKIADGDPAGLLDRKMSRFLAADLASHSWSEIMGLGLFGNQVPAGSPGDKITNLVAYGLGMTIKPTDTLSFTLDGWYAELEEDNAFGKKKLGTEINLKISFEPVTGLKIDMVAAYLFAGNATSITGTSTADPYEIGIQLTYNFD